MRETREREIAALDASMAQFDLGESAIVTMDGQADIPCEHGVVHVVPAWKWLLPNHLRIVGRDLLAPSSRLGSTMMRPASLGFDARQENLGEVVGLEFGRGVSLAVFLPTSTFLIWL